MLADSIPELRYRGVDFLNLLFNRGNVSGTGGILAGKVGVANILRHLIGAQLRSEPAGLPHPARCRTVELLLDNLAPPDETLPFVFQEIDGPVRRHRIAESCGQDADDIERLAGVLPTEALPNSGQPVHFRLLTYR
jgi:hypothetical protein